MRQTNIIRHCHDGMRYALLVVFLVLSCISANYADVQNVAVDTKFPGSGNIINSSGYVELSATWLDPETETASDTKPYTAYFKDSGGNVLTSIPSINDLTISTKIQATAINDTNGSPVTITVEIAGNNGVKAIGTSQAFTVDTKAPTLTANITNGPTFSQSSSVRIQITSNKNIKNPTVVCNGVAATPEGSLTTGTSFVFNLALTSAFSNGTHIINISAEDTTEPETGANKGSTTCSFTVGTSATGATTIDGASPASPSNAASVTLTGTSPTGVAKIALLDGTSNVTGLNTSSTNWTLSIQPTEGQHNYVVVSYDTNNQEISRSSAFPYTTDRTAPSVPAISAEGIPTQTNATSQAFTVNVEGYSTEVTPPVYLQGYNNDKAVGSKFNITTSGSPVNVTIPLLEGNNQIYFKTTDAAGNESARSEAVTINKSGAATAAVASVLIDSYSVPAPTTSMLGTGLHSFSISFNQSVSSAEPTVTITCGGGSTIKAKGTWKSDKEYTGNFTIPANGGPTIDGGATITVTDVKDSFGNTLPEYTQAAAFSIDSTAPTSTISGETNVYVSTTKQTVALTGNLDDGTGSGIDYLTLIVKDTTNGTEVSTTNIPLQTGAVTPWSYNFDAAGLGDSGTYKLVTSATDRAVPAGNTENYANKAGINIIVDKVAPTGVRISLNNTGVDMTDGTEVSYNVTRVVAVASETGSGLDFTNPAYALTLTGPNGSISGEKTNNGVDTIYFDFPALTETGAYTITFTPIDKAGNTGETVTRKFSINKSAPDQAEFGPAAYATANKTEENLANNQVKVTLSSTGTTTPSYTSSTISVKYNGNEVGKKENDETALIAKLHNGDLKADGSHDGNYYVTVVPYSTNGNAGNQISSSFVYDTQAPVVIESTPDLFANEGVWFGTSRSSFSITVSDAPKDILKYYQGQYSQDKGTQAQPGDVTWYNGSGTGINYSISSFSWEMGNLTSNPFTNSGNTLTLQAPTVPDDTAAGASDVEVTITLADNVTKGTDAPNKNTFTKTFKFDYLPPTINITTKQGSKYRGNTLKVTATAEDQGTNEELKVTQIEYSEDGTSWNQLSVSALPAKSATFELALDIANKTDGNHTVKFRAVDRAGNISEVKEFVYIIDRVPPPAPELTIPLPDYTVNKRGQNFKWTISSGANAYLFQISDDSSFNNVLNHTTNSEYSGLKGTVTTTTNGSFSLPKDGEYFWRVAAVEKCLDGYNVSEFSTTRKVSVDSVKPYVLSVYPTPSNSNTVTTGMVTFTFRFSETLDATVNLTANLTSAGGQVMKIEKISCTGDTWTGTTVIPKNNSSVYDGTAVISIQGATDLAGNEMVADSSHTIVVNTGPAFKTRLFSNPANEYEITILTKSSESLQTAPSVYVKQNSVKTPVTMNFLKDRYYSGSYKIDRTNPGSAYITISGTDLYGMVGNSTVEFKIADANASSRMSITTSSGRASLKAAEDSTYTPTSVYLIERGSLESPFDSNEQISSSVRASAGIRASKTNKNNELVGVLGLEQVCPSNTKLKKCMLYTADLAGEKINIDHNKVHIYRQDTNGKWVFQGGTLNNYMISAQITGFGRLALMADVTAPKLSRMSLGNNERLKTSTPEISGCFEDNGSGLQNDSFKLYIDGLQIPNVEIENDGSFRYQVKQALQSGKHQVEVEVKDKAGNSLRKAFVVTPPVVPEGEFRPYPNPATKGYIRFAYNFGASPESVSLKIYDSAGHLVAKFGTDDFGRANGKLHWDLTNRKGKKIANGTYIYRLEYVNGGQKVKKRGSLAVLR